MPSPRNATRRRPSQSSSLIHRPSPTGTMVRIDAKTGVTPYVTRASQSTLIVGQGGQVEPDNVSGGTALAVGDAEMVDGMIEIGSAEGVSAAPEGGAALAAIRHLVKSGAIKRHETVVLFNTGGALKYLDALNGR